MCVSIMREYSISFSSYSRAVVKVRLQLRLPCAYNYLRAPCCAFQVRRRLHTPQLDTSYSTASSCSYSTSRWPSPAMVPWGTGTRSAAMQVNLKYLFTAPPHWPKSDQYSCVHVHAHAGGIVTMATAWDYAPLLGSTAWASSAPQLYR